VEFAQQTPEAIATTRQLLNLRIIEKLELTHPEGVRRSAQGVANRA
jgi:hypothetical protein